MPQSKKFPLPEGHYFHPPVVSTRAHSGSTSADRAHIRRLQERLGVPETGVIDSDTVDAAAERLGDAWQGVVDAAAWEGIFAARRSSSEPSADQE